MGLKTRNDVNFLGLFHSFRIAQVILQFPPQPGARLHPE